MLSIPRDLWGNIPGQGQNRINSAFDTGANLLVQTIQADLGIPVNHYVEVNFDTFRDISNAVGGVNFYFPTPAKDAYSLLNITQAGLRTASRATPPWPSSGPATTSTTRTATGTSRAKATWPGSSASRPSSRR